MHANKKLKNARAHTHTRKNTKEEEEEREKEKEKAEMGAEGLPSSDVDLVRVGPNDVRPKAFSHQAPGSCGPPDA